MWAELLIALVIAAGVIAGGKAIITGFAILRRPSHHLAEQSGASRPSHEADLPPPP